jgi:uncharacterized protein (TIGR00730 family)
MSADINKTLAAWIRQFEDANLDETDTLRILAYARDLERGLSTIRTYPQGVSVFGSARLKPNTVYYNLAVELGEKLARRGHTVITGGGPGIMEAANKGAFEAGGRSIGLNIKLAHEQHPNPYLTEMLEFRYFFARKVMLTFSSKVYVFFPGGFGTMDEFSEILLLVQENKMPRQPMFLVGRNFWSPLDRFFKSRLEQMEVISKGDRDLFVITDNMDEIVRAADKIGHIKIDDNLYDQFSEYI